MQTLTLQFQKFNIQKIIMVVSAALVFFMLLLTPTYAQDCVPNTNDPLQTGANCAKPSGAQENLFGEGSIFQKVSNLLIFIIGAVSVIMLIIGGFRYVVSGGDSGGVESAKNTILYAIVGLVVAFLAYAAVNFVIKGISGT